MLMALYTAAKLRPTKVRISNHMLQSNQKSTSGRTRTAEILDVLRDEILDVKRHPGERLRFDELRKTYDIGISPLREALMHLASEGLVVSEQRRGYRVAPVSEPDLWEIAKLRGEFDALAIRESIEHGDDLWEGRVVAAFHALTKRKKVHSDGHIDPEWESSHIRFHATLVSGCNMPKLISFRQILEIQARRYRRVSVLYAKVARDDVAEHKAIQDATLDRNAVLAGELIQGHYRDTVELLLAGMESKDLNAFSV